jgi:hypothetical protein
MAQNTQILPRHFRFKSSLRRHPAFLAAVVAVTWLISTVCLLILDGSLASTLGWPWSREAVALVLVPIAGLMWLAMPARRVRLQIGCGGLIIRSDRGFRWRTQYIAWQDIERISLKRTGRRSKAVTIHMRPTRLCKRPTKLQVLKTGSTTYLPGLLSTMSDYATAAGYRMDGDLIDGHLTGHESWTVMRKA